jgi:hypothetical protein
MSIFRLIRKRVFRLTVTCLLIVQLLNLSVDYTDQSPFPEDLSVNEIESIIELVLEHVLDHKDVIQETEEDDSESVTSALNLTLFSFFDRIELCHVTLRLDKKSISVYQSCFESVSRQISTPPPKG